MKRDRLICYHGSPGVPQEFDLLRDHLPNVDVIALNRYDHRDFFRSNSLLSGSDHRTILLGYSWGVVDMLKDVSKKRESIDGIILVSPYALPGKSNSIKKLLMIIPIVSSLMLMLSKKKIVDDFISKTSSPKKPSKEYCDTAKILASPSLLRAAVLEKTLNMPLLTDTLNNISKDNVPLAMISGHNDTIDYDGLQADFFRQHVTFTHDKVLSSAGHAIVWTHPQELATFVTAFIKKVQ